MAHNVPNLGLNLDGGSKHSASAADEPEVFLFHNTGLYALGETLSYPEDNLGLYEHTGLVRDVGKFRIPTLRLPLRICMTAASLRSRACSIITPQAAAPRTRSRQISYIRST